MSDKIKLRKGQIEIKKGVRTEQLTGTIENIRITKKGVIYVVDKK